ncbi:hypothetical protein D355_01088 [Enterococcus faecium SD1C-2]|uniref:Uncharacterized protein n=1 Tax=Enterococcus faecium TaxID=1352 RepID=Q9X570_ENTFC|nr:unknown [Enterococcus faecium]EPI16950.1 hypothetical protein D355_01088 [Enterococcus faecium SD1C-2]EPI19402.1 hypothetical protein D353_01937 [Enterococcus faecium OC2A-1]EPI22495.1 hypothetical protein D352_01356 [Enterococcus faecium LA4B-2]
MNNNTHRFRGFTLRNIRDIVYPRMAILCSARFISHTKFIGMFIPFSCEALLKLTLKC